jgi:signal transduction histidine kinase
VQRDRLTDAGLALAVFALSLVLLAAGEGSRDGLGAVIAALASLPLVARRRHPLAVFLVTGLASVALRALAEPAGPPPGPTVALYFLALEPHSRRETAAIFALAAALLCGHAAALGGTLSATPFGFGIALWGAAWLAGDRARLREDRMAELEQRALRAEREAERERQLAAAEERARIARDLHDSAGHAINVILIHAGLGRLRAARDPELRDTFETIEDVARQTVADIDQLVAAMREDPGSGVEPPPGLAALETLVRRHRESGLDVTTTVEGERRALAPGVDRGAYRILQEALTNTARHGRGSASVAISYGASALELTVDNPVSSTRHTGGGHGLIGMRERAALLGGSVETTTDDGRFRLRARLPLDGGA